MFLNQLKTVVLLGLLTGILLVIGGLIGGRAGLTIAFVFAILMNFGMYFYSHKLVLVMYRAKPLSKKQAPKIHQMVEEIAKEAGIPKPKLYMVPTQTSNAFATGPSPKKAVVAVTEGIVKLLTYDELKGVLAHEIGHVKNRDMLVSTIAAALASVISYVAFMARWAAIFGGVGGRDRGGTNIVGLIVIGILAPIAALIIRLAISRSREYLADSTGAKFLKNGVPLARALEKLESDNRSHPLRFGSPSTSSLFIVNPFRANTLVRLLSTHPPIPERAKRLRSMKF